MVDTGSRIRARFPDRIGMIKRIILGVGTLCVVSAALAQYSFSPENADEQQPGIRYFGSAKDEKGAHLVDVTFLLDTDTASFVFVTDLQGRFRGTLPLGVTAQVVTPKCWKSGLETVRIVKRPGPKMAKKRSVQVDCVLRPIASKS